MKDQDQLKTKNKENKMNSLKELLLDNFTSSDMSELRNDEYNMRWISDSLKEKIEALGLTFALVDCYGGEDMGSEHWYVFSVEKDGHEKTLFRIDGWYQSFDGCYYDDEMAFYEVVPKEKIVIVYEAP